jgi:ATP-dependent DNA helicase RecG
LAPGWTQVVSILEFCRNPQPIQNIMEMAQWKDRTKFRNKFIHPFLELELIQMTIPDKPKSSKQKYQITPKGSVFLQLLTNN